MGEGRGGEKRREMILLRFELGKHYFISFFNYFLLAYDAHSNGCGQMRLFQNVYVVHRNLP